MDRPEALEQTAEDAPFTHCQQCGYHLRGLPVHGRCPECGQPYDKLWGVWRRGQLLVMAHNATLPRRCVKCNAPVQELNRRRTLAWHHPALILLLIIGILIYVIVALILTKKAKIQFGLCTRHVRKRRIAMTIAWLMMFVTVGLFGAALQQASAGVGIATAVMFLVMLLFIAAGIPRISAHRITNEFIWIKGVNRRFLACLPRWNLS